MKIEILPLWRSPPVAIFLATYFFKPVRQMWAWPKYQYHKPIKLKKFMVYR